jgi:DNA-binding protein HU-beta|nr:HU family DNA-binding protein [Leptospirillum ferriphilum]
MFYNGTRPQGGHDRGFHANAPPALYPRSSCDENKLIEKVSESSKISKKDVHAVIEGFLVAIEDSLKKGEKVALVGFGTFETIKREARIGRNPQTGIALIIPAKTVPKFSAGKAFREAMNATVKVSAPAKLPTSVKSTAPKKK